MSILAWVGLATLAAILLVVAWGILVPRDRGPDPFPRATLTGPRPPRR